MTSAPRFALLAAVVALAAMCASCAPGPAVQPSASPSRTVSAAPEPSSTPEATPAEATVREMSLRERAASVVMGHIPTTDAAALHAYMASSGVGGFLLMGANIPGDEAALQTITAALTVDPARPPLIAVDQEGGDVSRLPWDGFPAPLDLQQADPPAAEAAFAGRAALVRQAGILVNFGIVADVTADADSFIHRRVLGTTPDAASARVAAAVRGEEGSVFSTLKHFPGHGAAPGDSHTAIPSTALTLDQWRAADALPFQAGIDAGAELLMFGHLAYTAVDPTPASLSPEWHRIAREELGFDGVTITDDLGMLQGSGQPQYADPVANAVAALAAGNDMVLTVVYSTPDTAPRVVDGIVAAVESGALPAERLEEAATRVMELRLAVAEAGDGDLPCTTCAPTD
ncbi:glycoside hydrolase family 3 N-terminal domain-containing protein [Microbacterium sp. QXD-8]|uniref:Glycoside hydrolase family 3 N-terminal domain-containing protein n=1 Tax=Microbacterium psychrotolerans TaxID=3068321 RepID=A0ABU0YZD1_9MICO|nr:glycoside hydrolase family 3 N-terminal domain-containing protein [Microbacterium sp. QXD-8]MDQ7877689.1 glycoside hydrolase family 3 N-terminal domain-containing protein [Microbacterium sp. QXD-8]